MKPIWDRRLVGLLVDIGYTSEILEDYIIDKQWIQARKHIKHIRNQLSEVQKDLIKKDINQTEIKD